MTDSDPRINDIIEKLNDIREVQVEQKASLDHHIYRTDLAEDRLSHVEKAIELLVEVLNKIKGALIVLVALSGIATFAWTALQIIDYIKE